MLLLLSSGGLWLLLCRCRLLGRGLLLRSWLLASCLLLLLVKLIQYFLLNGALDPAIVLEVRNIFLLGLFVKKLCLDQSDQMHVWTIDLDRLACQLKELLDRVPVPVIILLHLSPGIFLLLLPLVTDGHLPENGALG